MSDSKAIGLIRVSTISQDLTQQTEAVKEEMKRDGYKPSNIILIEDKESAVTLSEEERQGIIKMKQYIESDPSIDAVYVFELSRLSRRPEVLYSVRDYLLEKKIQLVVIKPPIRLFDKGKQSESSSIMFAIFGALAEQEGYIRKERLGRGRLKAQSQGRYVGGTLPYGYTIGIDHKIVIDENGADMVRRVFDMYVNDKLSSIVIGKELTQTGEVNARSFDSAGCIVRSILRNTAYIGGKPFYYEFGEDGHKTGNRKQSQNIYPRIISDELFAQAQERMHHGREMAKTRHKNIYYCKGILKEAKSGFTLSQKLSVTSYSLRRQEYDGTIVLTVPMNVFDSLAWYLTVKYNEANVPAVTRKMRAELRKETSALSKKISNAQKKLVDYETQIDKIQRRIVAGRMKEELGDQMLNEIYQSQEELNEMLHQWQTELFNKSAYYHVTDIIDDSLIREDISTITDDQERYDLIHDTIQKIEITKYDKPHKRGTPVGEILVTYENNSVEKYYFHNYTKKVWDADMNEIDYGFVERFKAINVQKYWDEKNNKE